MSDGFWAPDGRYAQLVPTLVMLIWLAAVSVFLMRRTATVSPPERAAIPAA